MELKEANNEHADPEIYLEHEYEGVVGIFSEDFVEILRYLGEASDEGKVSFSFCRNHHLWDYITLHMLLSCIIYSAPNTCIISAIINIRNGQVKFTTETDRNVIRRTEVCA